MNILVTNFDNSGEDVMIFTENPDLNPETVQKKLSEAGKHFTDVYPVPDSELQYYLYEPCWIN